MPKISSPAPAERTLGAGRIVAAIADAATRWSDADFPPRVRVTAAVSARTGYSAPVVEYALDRLFAPLRSETLEASIAEELGSLEVLDRFVTRADGVRARAYPVGKVVVISSETTIGVALIPAIYALAAGCQVTVKDREDALVSEFFETLAQERPELRNAAVAQTPPDFDFRLADAIVAFGRDETLARIRAGLRPGGRFVGYGHRASIGYLDRSALSEEDVTREALRGAARDLVLYDGEGCMSLHALFVERGEKGTISALRLGELLLEAVTEAAIEFPVGRIDPRVITYQTGAAFRAALGRGSVFRTPAGDATLVVDPPHNAAPPFLPRVLPIYSIDGPAECEEYLRSHALPLEAFAVAKVDDEHARLGAALGAVRVTRFGEMQAPSPTLHHGGRSRIADFVRWVEAQ